MQNDSIETLLLRHYGSAAPAPADLEQRLCASVRQQSQEAEAQQNMATILREKRISRRRATTLVAIGAAGVGALSFGLEGLQALEAALSGQDTSTRPAYS
ncbi:MAG: hypothetical protein ABI456_19620 [Ktedonobacteraceae bacterium]|nr:hypothetical protein [Chloroflexota bacterium]